MRENEYSKDPAAHMGSRPLSSSATPLTLTPALYSDPITVGITRIDSVTWRSENMNINVSAGSKPLKDIHGQLGGRSRISASSKTRIKIR
jgi:hypothetical protein